MSEDPSLTADEQAKLKAFAQGLPDDTGEIDVDKIAQQTGTSRRQVLQVIAAVGVGSIAGGVSVSQLVGEAQAQASTSDSDGNVGTPADRVDVFADGIDAAEDINVSDTLSSDDVDINIDPTNGTTVDILEMLGGRGYADHHQKTTGVGTSLTPILSMTDDSRAGAEVLVFADNGNNNIFFDKVLFSSRGGFATAISKNTVAGSPPSRTYDTPPFSNTLLLAMGSGMFNVTARSTEVA